MEAELPPWVKPRILTYPQQVLERWEGRQGADVAVVEARRAYPGRGR